ncbi:hypothetical protein SAMN05444000_1252 [Shimia gijangensis]|uniref:Homeodomain-like domain-containing protein n=1 Tax=Shimia gijangensis TaxID=1470563 RepID=A0A1M6RDI4_9RHOB|nr:hypothetical protein SAMN05444000_1252 [Shimia gijangensis]
MKQVDLYGRVRHAVLVDGLNGREAARVLGIDPRTVSKMLAFSVPPGYRRSQPVRRPKLDAFTELSIRSLRQKNWFQRSSGIRRNRYLKDCVMSMVMRAASRL